MFDYSHRVQEIALQRTVNKILSRKPKNIEHYFALTV